MAIVMPGTLRSASPNVVAACCFMVSLSTTVTACGVSCRLAVGMVEIAGAFFSALRAARSSSVSTRTGSSIIGAFCDDGVMVVVWASAGPAIKRASAETAVVRPETRAQK